MARSKDLNRYLLLDFRRNLFEIKAELAESIKAEMWDRGWTKIYEVLPEVELSAEYQAGADYFGLAAGLLQRQGRIPGFRLNLH